MIIQGDCLEVLRSLPSGTVDMILCDLPYGTTRNKWDSVIPLVPLWEEYRRVTKYRAAIVLFAQVPFSCMLGASNLEMLRYEWTWKKGNASGFLNANKCPLKAHENLLVFYRKAPTYNPQFRYEEPYTRPISKVPTPNYGKFEALGSRSDDGKRYPIDVLPFTEERGLHPTQKPVPLCEYMIRTYTNEGETVLDSTMGSGTTGVAAANVGRAFIGIENNEAYYNLARGRLHL